MSSGKSLSIFSQTEPLPILSEGQRFLPYSLYQNSWGCGVFDYKTSLPDKSCCSPLTFFTSLISLSPSSKSFIPRLIREWNGAQAKLVNGVLWAIRLLSYLSSFLWIFLREATKITNHLPPYAKVTGGLFRQGCGFHQHRSLIVKQQQALCLLIFFAQLPDGMESQMLTRELNLHSPSILTGAGTKTSGHIFILFISGNLKWLLTFFFADTFFLQQLSH